MIPFAEWGATGVKFAKKLDNGIRQASVTGTQRTPYDNFGEMGNLEEYLYEGVAISLQKAIEVTKGTPKASIKSVDEILEGSNPGRATKGKATQYEKTGGFDQALDDFNSMGVTNVKDIPGGKVEKLPDGRTVNVRNKSSDGRPTLEIYDGKKSIKIRY